MEIKPKCSIEGCNNVAIGFSKNGRKYYRKFCNRHYELHYGIHEAKKLQRKASKYGVCTEEFSELSISTCSLCGWSECNCDIHRIVSGKDGGKYIKSNIVVLCPNCHRLVHRGIVNL